MRTVLIGIAHGFSARYILRTKIFRTLVSSNNVRLVILVPNDDDTYFRKEFERENVVIEKLKMDECKQYFEGHRIRNVILQIRKNVLNSNKSIPFIDDKYQKWVAESVDEAKKKVWLRGIVIRFLRRYKILRKLLVNFESFFWKGHFHRDLFLKYRPDLIIVFSNAFFLADQILLREAKHHKCKTMAIILSWDYPTSKGYGGATPDYYVCWTDAMKKELVQYLDISNEKIFVGGIAHFDVYHNKAYESRANYCKKHDLDPEKKILLFVTKSPTAFTNADIAHVLADAVENGKLCMPCQLLIRLHPNYYSRGKKNDLDEMNDIERRYPFVHINQPEILSDKLICDMPGSEMDILADILHHSDVMINMFSTMVIEAGICDTPIVDACFNGMTHTPRKGDRNISLDRNQIHNKRIEKTGGVQIAENSGELVNYVNKYLMTPSLDREGRKKIVDNEAGPYKGRAGQVIGNHILRIIGN